MQKRTVLFINWGREELPPSILVDNYDLQYIASEEALFPFIRRRYPSLIIIDTAYSDARQTEICKKIRLTTAIPVILLSSNSPSADVVGGLEAGADDFILKPVHPKELWLRVEAVLRRFVVNPDILRFPWAEINKVTRTITMGTKIERLTETEAKLLALLASHPNQVFRQEELLKLIWGHCCFGDKRVLYPYIKKLRDKIQSDNYPWDIKTVYCIGYKLEIGKQHNSLKLAVLN